MSDGTPIEWTDATWNIVNGCTVHSPGCTNCYAMKLAGTRLRNHPSRAGLTRETKAGPVWTGEVRFNDKVLLDPLRWQRPRRIFVCAHGDLFHENVPDEWIDRVFAVMALAPQHQFQVLTKRAERMRAYLTARDLRYRLQQHLDRSAPTSGAYARGIWRVQDNWPLPNVWLGVSVEDQERAEERIPDLLETPAAVRWISAEPLLGPLDLTRIASKGLRNTDTLNALTGEVLSQFGSLVGHIAKLDWIVAGGESGTGARPMHPDWARSLRDQCSATKVPFLFKQWGEYVTEGQSPEDIVLPGTSYGLLGDDQPFVYRIGKKRAGRLLDGVQHDGFPA